MPEYMLEVDRIPLTPSGKMRDWIADGRAVPEPVQATTGKNARSS